MRMRSGKRAVRAAQAVAGLATVSLVTACAGGTGGGAEIADGGGDVDGSGKTLTVWIMEGTNPDAEPYFEEVSEAFAEETGAELDVQFVPWSEAHDKFVKSIAGGTTPDVAEVGTTWTPEFADAGALVDLTSAVDDAGLSDGLVPGLVEAGTIDGELYGMPWYSGVRSIIYRTDVFEAAGVEVPTTWDEIVTAGEALEAADPEMLAFPVAGDSEFGVAPFIWGAGGELAVDEDGTWVSGVDSPEAQEGIAFYTGLATEHGFSSPAATTWDEADLSDSFARGDVGMMIAGSWTPDALVEANPDLEGKIGAFPIPGPDGGLSPSFLGGSHLSVFNTTDDPDLAFALVRLMSTGDLAEKWGDQSGYFPGTTELLEQIEAEGDPLVAPFAVQQQDGGQTVPVTPLYGQVQGRKTLSAMLQQILSGKADVASASEAAAAEMDEIFQRGS